MIAADTSSLIAYLTGDEGPDTALLENAMNALELILPPPVLTELRAGAVMEEAVDSLISQARLLPIMPGFWERAGRNRRLLITKGLKARLGDALIAQACIDSGVPLIARDRDFRHFEQWCGLTLAK